MNDWIYQDDFNQDKLIETFKRLITNLNVIDEYQEDRKIINTEQNYFKITVRVLDDITTKLEKIINFSQKSEIINFKVELIDLVKENIKLVDQKKEIFSQKAIALDRYLHG